MSEEEEIHCLCLLYLLLLLEALHSWTGLFPSIIFLGKKYKCENEENAVKKKKTWHCLHINMFLLQEVVKS